MKHLSRFMWENLQQQSQLVDLQQMIQVVQSKN